MIELAEEFERFREQSARCRKVFDTHCKLFRNDPVVVDLLKQTAHHVFFDLSDWLADYHVLLVCRLEAVAKRRHGADRPRKPTGLRPSAIFSPEGAGAMTPCAGWKARRLAFMAGTPATKP
ncbi:MAG: hypothetical protein R3D56_04620 [Paracoccaceae bacterium]